MLEYRLELNIDGVWVDMADPATRPAGTVGRLREQPAPSLTAGQQNETGDAAAARFTCQLDNRDGYLTPRRVLSPWYPHIEAHPQTRFSVKGAASQLQITGSGSRASTPDHASLHVTEPFLAVELAPPILFPAGSATYALAGRWNATGNQRSIILFLTAAGFVGLGWSETGTAATAFFAGSLDPVPVPVAGGLTVGVHLVPNNGAGGIDDTNYAGHRLADILADPTGHILDGFTSPPASSIHAGTAPLEVGDITGMTGDPDWEPYPGLIRRVQLREGGPTGTVVADLDVTGLAENATGVTDSAGRVWSFTNAPLTRWRTVRTLRADQILPKPHPVDGLQVADLTASGAIRRLGQGSTGFQSTLRRRIGSPELASSIKGYWPGEDSSGSTQLASPVPGVHPGKIYGSIQLASDDSMPGSKPLPFTAASTAMGWSLPIPVFTASSWRVDVHTRCPTTVTWTQLYDLKSTGTVREWIVEQNATGTLRLRGLDSAGTEVVNSTVSGPDLDRFASVSVLLAQNGGNVDYQLQYVELGSGTATGSTPGSIAATIGRPTSVGNLLTTPAEGMSFGHVVVSTGLDEFWLLPVGPIGPAEGFLNETAGRRLIRLGAEEGVAVRIVGDPDETALMGPQRADLDFLGQLRECALTDGGLLAEDPYTLGFVYRTLTSLTNQSPRIVFDLTTDGPLTPEPADDDYGLRNVVEAKRPGGSSAVATTNPPPAAADTYRDEPTVNVPTDLHLPDQAGWRVHVGSWEEMRYPTVGYLATTPTQVEELLEVGPGDLARTTGLPDDMPATTVDQLVLGDRTQPDSTIWLTTLNMTPAGPYEIGVYDDPDQGRYNTDGSELAADFDAGTDTTMSVATTLGRLWTTTPSSPLLLWVGGAQVTATAVSGASSPQTFTVSTTVPNADGKTIPAGSKVRLWRPTIYALT